MAEARAVGLGWDAIAAALPTRPLEEIQRRHAARSCSQAGPLDGSFGAALDTPFMSAISHYAMSVPHPSVDHRCQPQLCLLNIRSPIPRSSCVDGYLSCGSVLGGPQKDRQTLRREQVRARVVAAEARRKAGAPAGPPLPLRRGPHLHTLQLSARLLPSWSPAWKACDCQARDDVHTKPQPQLSILTVLPLLLVAAGFMSQQFHSMQPLSSAAGPCTAAAVESPPPQDAAGTAAAAQQAQQAQLPLLTVDARGVGWKVVAPLSLGPPTMTSPHSFPQAPRSSHVLLRHFQPSFLLAALPRFHLPQGSCPWCRPRIYLPPALSGKNASKLQAALCNSSRTSCNCQKSARHCPTFRGLATDASHTKHERPGIVRQQSRRQDQRR